MARKRRTAVASCTLLVVFMMIATAIWATGGASAQEGASRTVTLLAARCPANYVGAAAADECDDTPMPGVTFRAGRPSTDFFLTATTDAAGLVSFGITDLPLNGTIRLIEELPPRTARIVVYCVDQAGTPLQLIYVPMYGNVPPIMVADIAVGETGDAYCDWYNVSLE